MTAQMAPGPGPKPSGPSGPGDNRPPAGPVNPPPPKAHARIIATLAATTALLLVALFVVAAGYAFPRRPAPVGWTVSFQFRDNHPGDNAARYYAAVATTDGARWYFSTAGGLGLTRIEGDADPGESWQLPAGINPDDGQWHAFTGRVRQNGADVEASLWLDGVLIGHDTHVMSAHVAPVASVGRGGKPYAGASNEFQLAALAVT